LLADGIGDTIRVSLTEDPEFEIPVCQDLIAALPTSADKTTTNNEALVKLPYSPFEYKRRDTFLLNNIGIGKVPIVVADFMHSKNIAPSDLESIGYTYNTSTDKWRIADGAADYMFTANTLVPFNLPGTLQVICNYATWKDTQQDGKYVPLFEMDSFIAAEQKSKHVNFISVEAEKLNETFLHTIKQDETVVLCLFSSSKNAMQQLRTAIVNLMQRGVKCPVVIAVESMHKTVDEQLIHFSATAGGLFLDGMGDGIWLMNDPANMNNERVSGRTYLPTNNNHQFLNNTAFSILQATRTRISKTEYISCPSCGRTLFDLQETTAKIRNVTSHLKGLKIAIMGCIVNGPGEMADADFGYVGSGPGKITLYKGKEVVKRNIDSEIAVDELITLLKTHNVWIAPNELIDV